MIVLRNNGLFHNETWEQLVIRINHHNKECLNIPIKNPMPSALAFVCYLYY